MHPALAVEAYEPSLQDWINAIQQDPKYLIGMAIYYWPWTLGIVISIWLLFFIRSASREYKKPTPPQPPRDTSSPENYAKLMRALRFFVEEMRSCGNPGLEFELPESIAFDRLRAKTQDYGAASVAIPFREGYWRVEVNDVYETPGDMKAERWRELIVTPALEWAVLGVRFRKFYSGGRDRESSVLTAKQGRYTKTAVSSAVLGVALVGVQALLREYSPEAIPEFQALCDES